MSSNGTAKGLKFIQKKIEVPIEIEHDDGLTHHYVLRKASGNAVAAFRKVMLQGAKIQGNKMVGLGNASEAEPVLIAQCMREVTFDGEGKRTGDKPVLSQEIATWDYSIIKGIMDELKKISDMKDLYGSDDPKERLKEIEEEKKELLEAMAEEDDRKNS